MVTDIRAKAGYKETDVGNLPNDWELTSLGTVCEKIQDGNYGESYPKSNEFLSNGVPFLTSKAIGKDGNLKTDLIDFISDTKHAELAKAHIELNDVLFTNRGSSVGAIGYVDERIAGGNIGPQLTLLRANNQVLLSEYLYHFLKSEIFQKQVMGQDSGSAMNFFGISQTMKFKIPIPSKHEQQEISKFLSGINVLVKKLKVLIEKKSNIKQGTMQELLTGKRRLSGFRGEWEEIKLGNLCEIKKGQLITENTAIADGIPVIGGGIGPSYYHNKPNRRPNTVTISASGANAGYVSFHRYPIFASDCSTIENSENYNITFIYYILLSKQQKITSLQTGGAQPHVYPEQLKNLDVIIPKEMNEQNAIAEILQDMDTEISELENQKNKYLEIKQGMMQQLLTGRIRLV